MTNGRNVPKRSLTNGLGQLAQVEECQDDDLGNGVQCNWKTTNYGYDVLGNMKAVTDTLGNLTSMSYDALSRKTEMWDPDMGHWTYSYDGNGNLISQTDAKTPAQVLTFYYDVLNRMVDKYLNGAWTSWNRYDEGFITANAIGRRTRHGMTPYQSANWSNETYFSYDARGRMTLEQRYIDSAGWFNTGYTYDSADRVTTMTYPDNEVVTTSYDNSGQPLSLGGTNAYVSSASYNALGQPTVFTLGNTLSQRWYYFGSNLSAPHVQNGNANWSYGKLRQSCVLATSLGDCFDWTVRPGGSSNTQLNLYSNYDVAGNVTQMYDRGTNGSPNDDHAYAYDALDRLTSWKMNTVAQESYTYNAIGNLMSKTGVGSYEYKTAVGWGCSAGPHAVMRTSGNSGFCYDANGNNTLRWDPSVPFIYGQTWNADNKLTRINKYSTDGAYTDLGTLAEFYYDADGTRVKSVVNGTPTAYIGNHYEVKDTPNTYVNVTFAKTVGVNVTGNTLQRNTGNSNWGGSGASSTAYCAGGGYCAAYANAAATNTDSMYGLSNADTDASYTSIRYGLHLQSTGQVLIYESSVYRGTFGSYAVGDKFSVQAESDNKVRYYRLPSGSGAWQLLYTSTDIPTYPLRMDSAIYSNGGQLVSMQMYGSALKTPTSYYYFGGQRVAMRTPTDGLAWLHSDHLGSSSMTTNSSGGTVASARYKPFGEVRTTSGTMPTNRKFGGKIDDGFGLLDFSARQYSPLLGRFISADTVVPGAGNPQALNRYAYVLNRPLNMIDPTGHAQISPEGGGCSRNPSPWLCSSNRIRAGNEAELKQTRRTPGGELAKSGNAQSALAQKLIDWHVQERGPLVLTKDEAMATNPHFDLNQDTNFQNELGNLTKREGGRKHIKSSVLGAADTTGTLGRNTLRYDGDLEVNPDGSWSFEGTATLFDTWDFNILPLRPTIESEAKTIVGNVLLGSYSYDIYSEPLRVSQSSGQKSVLFPEYPNYTPTHIKNAEADSEFH